MLAPNSHGSPGYAAPPRSPILCTCCGDTAPYPLASLIAAPTAQATKPQLLLTLLLSYIYLHFFPVLIHLSRIFISVRFPYPPFDQPSAGPGPSHQPALPPARSRPSLRPLAAPCLRRHRGVGRLLRGPDQGFATPPLRDMGWGVGSSSPTPPEILLLLGFFGVELVMPPLPADGHAVVATDWGSTYPSGTRRPDGTDPTKDQVLSATSKSPGSNHSAPSPACPCPAHSDL